METHHRSRAAAVPASASEALKSIPENRSDLSWSGLWARLSRHADGSPRVALERAEQMVMELRSCDLAGEDQKRAETLRDTLSRFCDDLSLFDVVQRIPPLSGDEERQVLDEWFSFRCSAHSWGDLIKVIRATERSPLVAPLVAQEISSERDRYLADLRDSDEPRNLMCATRVVRFLSGASPLLSGDKLHVLPALGAALCGGSTERTREYITCLLAYVMSPGLSIEHGLTAALQSAHVLPERIDVAAQAGLLQLGDLLGRAIATLPSRAVVPLLDLPEAILIGISPAIISRLHDDVSNPESHKTLCALLARLPGSFAKLDPSLRAQMAEPLSNQALRFLPLLDPSTDAALIRQLAPWAVQGDWFRREAQILWDILSSKLHTDYYPIQVQLVRNILESSEATDSFCGWCHSQAGFHCFAERFKSVGALVGDFLRARKDFGEGAVAESECLRALSVVSSLGPSAKGLIPQVAGLMGIAVVDLPYFGPKVLPFSLKGDPSPRVIAACRHLLKVLSPLCRPDFVAALERHGV